MKRKMLILSALILIGGCFCLRAVFCRFKSARSPLLRDVLLLEKLSSRKGRIAEQKLASLASGRDGVGYLANIELAGRYCEEKRNDPLKYYNRALELYDSKGLRKTIASCLEERGRISEAADMYASALPDSGALESLLKMDGPPEIVSASLIKYRRYRDAADYIKPKLSGNLDERTEAALERGLGIALGQLGLYEDALPYLKKRCAAGASDQEEKWWYGRALEALGQTESAKGVYASVGRSGAHRLGLILEGEGKLNEAAAMFVSSDEAVSVWRGACLYDRLDSVNSAADAYRQLARGDSGYRDDAAYRAYVLARQNNLSGAEEMFSLIEKYPAWMARLGRKSKLDIPDIGYEKPEFLFRVEEYRRSGRQSVADVELAIGQKFASALEKGAIAEWYLKEGRDAAAAAWAEKAIAERPGLRAYRIAYPKPFAEDVGKVAAEFHVDENLIWALMREESSFQPDAVSNAGALGLMQLMPSTAAGISSRLSVSLERESLMKPAVNIRFGTYYLRCMLDMFSGDADMALAAYNAGAGNVKRWSGSKIGSAEGGFPTAITYFETREYITKVMNSYYIYGYLY